MEVICSSETPVYLFRTTRYVAVEDIALRNEITAERALDLTYHFSITKFSRSVSRKTVAEKHTNTGCTPWAECRIIDR
jgi:hypothetical protein